MATSKLILDIIARDGASGVFKKLTAEATAFNKATVAMGKSVAQAGDRMSLGLTLPLVGLGYAAVKTQASFEQSMNVMAKASGASAVEMENLSELAKQMGADTVFSANESAEAMVELAKGGLSPAEIEAGGLASTMALAATEGMALADAGTVITNAMGAFSIKAKDSVQVADALAGAANESTASVESLSQALRQVGPGATNAGLSLNETVAVLAAFDAAGVKGSDAGTSLKTMLASLVPKSEAAAKSAMQMGLDFTNANGSFKDITEIAQILQDRLGNLSEAQRTQTLNTVFGSDATRAATILMKEGEEGLQRYIDATEKQGAAQELADARMQGTAGSLEQMTGSLETAALAAGEALAPTVVDLAAKVKGAAEWFTNLDDGTQKNIVKMGLFVAAAGPMLSILGRVTQAVGTAQGALSTLGLQLQTAPGAGRFTQSLGRMATFLGGPWGLAVGVAATVAIPLLVKAFKGAESAVGDYTAELAANSGALSKNSREQIALELAQDGQLEMAARLGISTKTYTLAVLGNEKATKLVTKRIGEWEQASEDVRRETANSGGVMSDYQRDIIELGNVAGDLHDKFDVNAGDLREQERLAELAASAQRRLNAAVAAYVPMNAGEFAGKQTGSGKAYANGGWTHAANGRYIVGEYGPEQLIMGRSGGRVIPHSRSLREAGGATWNIYVPQTATDPLAFGREAVRQIKAYQRANGGAALGLS